MSPPTDELMKQEISEEILPTEIWSEIGKWLKSRLDVSRFRSVCRTWRSALPVPSRFPLRVPAPPGKYIKREFASYFISELTFYAADQLIVMFEEQYEVAKFTASALRPEGHPPNLKFELPPVSQISNLSFLSNAFHIQSAIPSDCPGKYKIGPTDVLKIAVISSNSDDFNPNYAIREGDLTVVAHLIDRKLAALRLRGGAMNNQWETGFCDSTFEDIINYNGRVYAVDRWGKVFVMDCNSLQMTQVGTGLPLTPGRVPYNWKLLHLAVSADSGHLYLIVHYPLNTNTYHHVRPKVYKLISRLSSESRIRHLNKWWPLQDEDKCIWVVNLMSNFPVPIDLLRSDDEGWIFFFSLLGITPLGERLGYCTEQLAFYTVPTDLHLRSNEVHKGKSELALSRFSSCIMLIAYVSYLYFPPRSEQNLYSPVDVVWWLDLASNWLSRVS